MQINFTITATCRPEILRRTLTSFNENLRGIDLSKQMVFLNLDPAPASAVFRRQEVVNIASEFFQYVKVLYPDQPSFPAAVKWCWMQPFSKFFFHLEDDWALLRPFSISPMIHLLENEPSLSCVTLRAYSHIRDERICLSPGLFRTFHAMQMAGRMTTTANPEKQLRPTTPGNPEGDRHGHYVGTQISDEDSHGPLVSDLGREWMRVNNVEKEIPVHFTKWK